MSPLPLFRIMVGISGLPSLRLQPGSQTFLRKAGRARAHLGRELKKSRRRGTGGPPANVDHLNVHPFL